MLYYFQVPRISPTYTNRHSDAYICNSAIYTENAVDQRPAGLGDDRARDQ